MVDAVRLHTGCHFGLLDPVILAAGHVGQTTQRAGGFAAYQARNLPPWAGGVAGLLRWVMR